MSETTAADKRLRLGLFVYLFVTLAYFMPGASWSPVSRYCLTRAIVERRSLQIDHCAAATGDRARVGEHFYSEKAPLPSLAAVPAYAAFYATAKLRHRFPAFKAEGTDAFPARRVVVSPAFRQGLYVCSLTTSALSGAFLGVAVYAWCRRRIDDWFALLAAISSVVATPVFPYGTSFFGHTIAAALLVGAVALLDPLRSALTPQRSATAGALLGLAAGCEYIVAFPALLLGLWGVWLETPGARLRRGLALSVGAAAPLGVVAAYHTACFGLPWRTGYTYIVHPGFAAGQASGFFGIGLPRLEPLVALLIGPERGLWYLSPVCLVASILTVVVWRRHRDPTLLAPAMVFTVLLLLNAGYFQWNGGWATGPRHLVPALGLLGIGMGHAFASPRLRSITAVLAGLSASVLLLTTAVALEAPPHGSAVFDYMIPAVREGRIARISGASNWGLELGLGRRASLLPVLAWVLTGPLWLRVLATRSNSAKAR